MDKWRAKAEALKMETYALVLAYRDPRVPWFAKVFTGLVVAYALSPIDLIPDFIPVLGYADDFVIIPLGVWLAMKMIPAEVMAECRARAASDFAEGKGQFRWMAVVVILVWVAGLVVVGAVLWRAIGE